MGTKVPPEPFVIDPAKSYTVTVDWWVFFPGPEQCGGTYMGKDSGVRFGWQIIDFIDDDRECTTFTMIRPPLPTTAERIFSIVEV